MLALVLASVVFGCRRPSPDEPPPTPRQGLVEMIHGVEVPDPFRWLEDDGDRRVRRWMRDQDAWARARLSELPERRRLRARYTELLSREVEGVPVHRGSRTFFMRRGVGQEKAVLMVEEDGKRRILLDPNAMSTSERNVSLRGWWPSPQGDFLAYKISENAADRATLALLQVDDGSELRPDRIAGAKYASPSWTKDGRGFYYTAVPDDPKLSPPEQIGAAEVRFHEVGTPPRKDLQVVAPLGDPTSFIHVDVGERWLIQSVFRGWESVDLYIRPLEGGAWRPLFVGQGALAQARDRGGRFFVQTNAGAPRFRVVQIDPEHPEPEAWKEVVSQTDDTLLGFGLVDGNLLVHRLRKASSALELRRLDGSLVREIELPELGSVGPISIHEGRISFGYTSFVRPFGVFETSVDQTRLRSWSGGDADQDTPRIEVEQVWVTSKDGTRVSMFVVHRSDVELDGHNPTLLTGYGGFGVSMTPLYSPFTAAWVEEGGVWALPNLRGGGEYGEDWHQAGRGPRKQNVFDDFIASAQWLIGRGFTRPEHLIIYGGSNGGLLVGAAMTQRPDLFGGVICAVPLLDMIRYHRFGSGITWTPEYGSAEDPDEFRTLLAYSPYHNLRPETEYPPVLMLSADSDDRVDPMHARKFVGALQVDAQSTALLRIERGAGHGGADRLSQTLDLLVDIHAFARSSAIPH